jgi:Co/Zn/Cd efflux system component
MPDASPPARHYSRARSLPIALGALVLLGLVLHLGARPPAPRPATVPADEFSAERALAVLERLLAEGVPHPVGSPAHFVVRDRILDELTALGYEPELQRAFSCRARGGSCAWVENIVAQLPGGGALPAVMLSSHYDSRGAGPGAADAGAGVAALLEVARILRLEGPYAVPVVLLLTDGEEVGLLGAEAFVREHRWAGDVGVAINLEARGSSGPSLMFETSANNRWLVTAWARAARRPVTNSLTYDIYRRLPNDTDATVFRRAGMDVLNFAFIDELVHYHSERDDIGHLDPRSVQHHGDNALAAVRALARAPLEPRAGDATYTDVFGVAVLSWPASWTLPLAVLFTLVIAAAAIVWLRRRSLRAAEFGWALLATLAALVLAVVVGWVSGALLAGVTGRSGVAHAHAWAAYTALWAGALAVVLATSSLLAARAGFHALLLAPWLVISLLAVALAAVMPGGAVMLVVPQAVAAVAIGFAVFGPAGMRSRPHTSAIIAALGAGFTLIQLARMLQSTFVLQLPFAITAIIGLAALPLMPLTAVAAHGVRTRRIVIGGAAIVAVLAFGAALLLPGYTERRPQPLNIVYLEHAGDAAVWAVQGVADATGIPTPLRTAAAFTQPPPAWAPPTARGPSAPTEPLNLPPPRVEILAQTVTGHTRVVSARIHAAQPGNRLLLDAPAAATLRVDGHPVAGIRSAGARQLLLIHGMPEDGVIVELVYDDVAPLSLVVFDHTPGLPAAGEALRAARPAHAARIGDGDVSVVRIEVDFGTSGVDFGG